MMDEFGGWIKWKEDGGKIGKDVRVGWKKKDGKVDEKLRERMRRKRRVDEAGGGWMKRGTGHGERMSVKEVG